VSTPPAVSRDFAEAFLQVHFPNTHGGLTVAGRKRPQLQLRYSHPRRADPRRSCECAFVHRKNPHLLTDRTPFTKSGGHKPPRGMFSVCEPETWKSDALPLQPWFPTSAGLTPVAGRKRPQLQLRYSHPRRAHARRSWLCIRRSPNITRLSPDGALIPVPQRADEGRSWFGRCCGELPGLRPVWS
jgi:hypothetical protein